MRHASPAFWHQVKCQRPHNTSTCLQYALHENREKKTRITALLFTWLLLAGNLPSRNTQYTRAPSQDWEHLDEGHQPSLATPWRRAPYQAPSSSSEHSTGTTVTAQSSSANTAEKGVEPAEISLPSSSEELGKPHHAPGQLGPTPNSSHNVSSSATAKGSNSSASPSPPVPEGGRKSEEEKHGLKPEVVMAIVVAGTFGIVFAIVGVMLLYRQCLQPRLQRRRDEKV